MTKPRGLTLPILCLLAAACWCGAAAAEQVEVHDPVMARQGDSYYVFSTGPGITIYRSEDLERWRWVGRAFDGEPDWARDTVPGFNGHLWAPDVFEKDGRWYLYYSVSAFGKNTSAIGVTVNETLDPDSPDYAWVDHGPILQSVPFRDRWNAIDPAIVEDEDGTPWMSFGSFWDGIKLVRLDPSLTRLAEPQEWHSLARRPHDATTPDDRAGAGAVEAPFIFRKDGWYYLFVSFDKCCRGLDSTYRIMVGRSRSVTGPYVDQEGTPMLEGGGSEVLAGTESWVALGHNAAYTFDGEDWLVFHAYETADDGRQKLRVLPMRWQDGWPVVDPADLDRRTTELLGAGPPENDGPPPANERPEPESAAGSAAGSEPGNPLFEHVFTADPAALVVGDTVWLYTGHDEAPNNDVFFEMHDWLAFSSKDMKSWQEHGPILRADDFAWAEGSAWASHMVEKDGRFWFYATVRHDDTRPGFAIGVAVADSPTGPFRDARGSALVTNDMTTQTANDWDDIDPAVWIEESGDAYLFFGNLVPKYVKLADDMVELDGEIRVLDLPNFTEAAWVHKRGERYYLSYACFFPEKTCYATSDGIHGPWEYQGILNEIAGNSETNHQSIVELGGDWYFVYHTGAVPPRDGEPSGGRFRRSVAIDRLYYEPDGRLKRVIMTTEGIR